MKEVAPFPLFTRLMMLLMVSFLCSTSFGECRDEKKKFWDFDQVRRVIVGGREVKNTGTDADLKSVVAKIRTKKNGGSFICSGTVIAPKVILTAAHCLFDKTNNKIDVSNVGLELDGKRFGAADYIVHEAFANDDTVIGALGYEIPNPKNDIALIFLEDPVPAVIEPAKVPVENFRSSADEPAELVGYGTITISDKESIGKLRVVDVYGDESIDKGTLTVWGDKNFCSGDSGGPALLREGDNLVVIGVMSSSSPNCDAVGNLSLVSQHGAWIKRQIEKVGGKVSI